MSGLQLFLTTDKRLRNVLGMIGASMLARLHGWVMLGLTKYIRDRTRPTVHDGVAVRHLASAH